jgi:hypothetical protein
MLVCPIDVGLKWIRHFWWLGVGAFAKTNRPVCGQHLGEIIWSAVKSCLEHNANRHVTTAELSPKPQCPIRVSGILHVETNAGWNSGRGLGNTGKKLQGDLT